MVAKTKRTAKAKKRPKQPSVLERLLALAQRVEYLHDSLEDHHEFLEQAAERAAESNTEWIAALHSFQRDLSRIELHLKQRAEAADSELRHKIILVHAKINELLSLPRPWFPRLHNPLRDGLEELRDWLDRE